MTDTERDYPKGLSPEDLMAYADGALDGSRIEEIERLIAEHPWLADEVEAFRASAAVLKDAFNAPLEQPVPPHLEVLVMGSQAAGSNDVVDLGAARTAKRFSLPQWGAQAAAACAVFALGIMFGVAQFGSSGPGADEDLLLLAGRLDAAHPVAIALSTASSSDTTSIGDGSFHPVLSFVSGTGVVCREFEASNASGAVIGIACPEATGWRMEVLLAASSGASAGEGFRLASGFDEVALDAVLARLGAGEGLDMNEERCLIDNSWKSAGCIEN